MCTKGWRHYTPSEAERNEVNRSFNGFSSLRGYDGGAQVTRGAAKCGATEARASERSGAET